MSLRTGDRDGMLRGRRATCLVPMALLTCLIFAGGGFGRRVLAEDERAFAYQVVVDDLLPLCEVLAERARLRPAGLLVRIDEL